MYDGPSHSGENSDPAHWENPPVPEPWWPVIRAHTPAYDPAVTPSTGVGVIPETVRTWPGAQRSSHPRTSFAAVGPAAREVIRDHRLDHQLGEESPLGRIYALDGDVLLLGVGHGCNTSLHLAEYRLPGLPSAPHHAAIHADEGERRWVTWTDVDIDESDFVRLGADFDAAACATGGLLTIGTVGSAECRLVRQRVVVDFAVRWLSSNRLKMSS
ncbi:MAG: aminoglycoside N(3)-acetyltransferase [Actinopolymorphaceae bacterium]